MTSLEIIKDELAKIEKDEDHILAGRQGNMIKYLSKALSVAVTTLDRITDLHCDDGGIMQSRSYEAIEDVAEILSGGKPRREDGK